MTLPRLFFAPLGLTLALAMASSPAAGSGPSRPMNPANAIPVPDDQGLCDTGPDRAFRMVMAVVDQCAGTFVDNRVDYAWIIAHMVAEIWVPGADAMVMGELMTKLGKDATVCVLTGFVGAGGGSPQAQALAKASIQELREVLDRAKYYDKATRAWNDFSAYGKQYVLADKDHKKFLTYLDKKTFDRMKSTAKESSLVGKLINYADPTHKAKTLLPEARTALEACQVTKALAAIQAAQEVQLDWLKQVRGEIGRLKKELRCLKEQHWKTQEMAPAGGSVVSEQARTAFIDQRDTTEFEIEKWKQLDADQTQALQETADLQATIENQARIVEATLRAPFREAKAEAERALAACDYARAESIIDGMKQWTTDPPCAVELKDEYYRELDLKRDLVARLDKRRADEETIERRYLQATAPGQEANCRGLAEEAGYLAILTRDACIDRTAVEAKIKNLEAMARRCEQARNAAVAPPPPPGGPEVARDDTPVPGAFGPPKTRFGKLAPNYEDHEKKFSGVMSPESVTITIERKPVEDGAITIKHVYAGNRTDILRPGDIIDLTCTSTATAAGKWPPNNGTSCFWHVSGSVAILEPESTGKGAIAGVMSDGTVVAKSESRTKFKVLSGGGITIRAEWGGFYWGQSDNWNPAEYIYTYRPE